MRWVEMRCLATAGGEVGRAVGLFVITAGWVACVGMLVRPAGGVIGRLVGVEVVL